MAILAAVIALIAVGPSPARAAAATADPSVCRTFAGDLSAENYLYACRKHIRFTSQVLSGAEPRRSG
jgi:hypothetical protein